MTYHALNAVGEQLHLFHIRLNRVADKQPAPATPETPAQAPAPKPQLGSFGFDVPWAREMEAFWGAKLIDTYASTQCGGGIASTCEHGTYLADGRRGMMHFPEHKVWAEVLNPQTGELRCSTSPDNKLAREMRDFTFAPTRYADSLPGKSGGAAGPA